MSNPFALMKSVKPPRAPHAPRPSTPLQQLRVRSAAAGYRKALRADALRAYGSKCSCCDEPRPAFLIFVYTESGKSVNGQRPLKDLKARGWPPTEARIECFNCHLGARIAGVCPHTRETDARRLEKSTRPPTVSVQPSSLKGESA